MADRTNGPLSHPSKSSAEATWNALKTAGQKLGAGMALKAAAKKVATPAVRWIIPKSTGVLIPNSLLRTGIGSTLGRAGSFLLGVNPAVEALKIIALNPTNRFPGSSAERAMIRAATAKIARANLVSQVLPINPRPTPVPSKQVTLIGKHHGKASSLGKHLTIHKAGKHAAKHGSTFALKHMKLRPVTHLSTPFNLRLMQSQNPASRFGLHTQKLSLAPHKGHGGHHRR